MNRTFRICQFDAFSSKIFGGNPAAVVFDAERLTPEEMRSIARELNLSATVFLLPSETGDFRLIYLSRTGNEIRFCGHGTVAALYAVDREKAYGIANKQQYRFTIETRVGPVPASIDLSRPEGACYEYISPPVDLVASDLKPEDFGIGSHLIDSDQPLMLERKLGILYMTAKSMEALGQIALDPLLARQSDDVVSVAVLRPEGRNGGLAHVRVFAPLLGIPEDPFSGSVHPGLLAYLRAQKMIPHDLGTVNTEQGHFMGRDGGVELEIVDTDPLVAKLHCKAAHVFSTELTLP